MWQPSSPTGSDRLLPMRGLVRSTIGVAALVMLWGAFVAGLDAGMVYNSFPTMNGYWFPPEAAQHLPVWKAFFEEPATVQWTHRVLAILFLAKVFYLLWRGFKLSPPLFLRRCLIGVGVVASAQVLLGITTLLSQVNITLATLHQGGALIMLLALIVLLHNIPKRENNG